MEQWYIVLLLLLFFQACPQRFRLCQFYRFFFKCYTIGTESLDFFLVKRTGND